MRYGAGESGARRTHATTESSKVASARRRRGVGRREQPWVRPHADHPDHALNVSPAHAHYRSASGHHARLQRPVHSGPSGTGMGTPKLRRRAISSRLALRRRVQVGQVSSISYQRAPPLRMRSTREARGPAWAVVRGPPGGRTSSIGADHRGSRLFATARPATESSQSPKQRAAPTSQQVCHPPTVMRAPHDMPVHAIAAVR